MSSKHKILIVDDDLDIRFALSARLVASGFDTEFACDGPTALAAARDQDPNMIILDLGLPNEDGFAVLGQLKADPALSAIPVVILSARDAYDNEKRAIESGAYAFLQKPANNEALLSAIHTALD